jgi:hypothetical protein
MSSEDIENLKRGYAAFNSGDVDAFMSLMEDVR